MGIKNWLNTLLLKRVDQSIIEEDVLKYLYKNEEKNKTSNFQSINNELVFSEEQIDKSIQQLIKNQSIVNSNQSLLLEEKGRTAAIKLIRRHRIYEKYLSEKTGFSKSSWHHKAEEMEHALTDEEVNLMSKELGNPQFDPHGDPIPTKDGQLPKLKGISLSKIEHNCTVKVLHIEDEPKRVYKSIIKQGLHIGSIMTINFTSSVYATEGHALNFNKKDLENITVQVLKEEEEIPKGIVRLSLLKKGEKAVITGLSSECRGINRRRLLDLGFVKGSKISINMVSPLSDPTAYLIRETLIALRKEQTDMILIKKINNDAE
ncbi:DtxR family transcriptional regulator [Flammeovirga sp. EKP202]|uniref:metal-dependent transcriptional regulator n=1 Tax=Flammeovirga sp. EKP202 TaxID=2770592 RepID=UPI00165EDC5D|nr:iron dependent repressor, metal binding and dimerization domain protein [Flammeovirga sp. EKP202]MBD0405158.1 FeoA domain-containing protein [Flammeovirga sp. EKP202]